MLSCSLQGCRLSLTIAAQAQLNIRCLVRLAKVWVQLLQQCNRPCRRKAKEAALFCNWFRGVHNASRLYSLQFTSCWPIAGNNQKQMARNCRASLQSKADVGLG